MKNDIPTGSVGLAARKPVRRELRSISTAVPPHADTVVMYAADELRRLVRRLFGIDAEIRLVQEHGCQLMLLASKGSSLTKDSPAPHFDQPKLETQEYLIQPLANNGAGSLLLAGGSPAALLWAVYELAEFWGVRFLLNGEIFPPPSREFILPSATIRRKPLIPLRAWRGLNQLPHSGAHWGLSDYVDLIDQLARLRFNCFYVMLPAYAPFVDFEWCGLRRHTAELDFGWRFPIDEQTIGREKFNGSPSYENPDIPSASSYAQKIAAASTLVDGIRSHARSRGISLAVRFVFTEFPEEFKEHLRELSLRDGFVPSEVKSGGYVYRLGISREGLDPTYSPFMSIRNPRFVDLAGTQLRAYLDRYGDAEYLVLHPPEFANAGGDADFAWGELAERFELGPIENLNRLISDAIESLKGDPNCVTPRRLDQQIRAHICNLYLLDELLHKRGMATLYQGFGARLVVGVPFSSLAPLTAKVLGDDVEVMQLLGSGYLASDAARHADDLKRTGDHNSPVHLTISIEDDNIGLTPQFTAPSLAKIVTSMNRHGVTGLWCRQWLLSKLEPAILYVSRACWDSSLTPLAAYTDLIESICGKEAIGPLLKAFQLAEQITMENDAQGNIHSFLTPCLLASYWDLSNLPKPSMLAMRPKFQQLAELFGEARAACHDEGRRYVDQFIGQCRFAEHWIHSIEKLACASQANLASQNARQSGDVDLMDQQLQLSVKLLDESLEACRAAISAWADAVRDRADLGALAALNQFGYRVLLSIRHLQYIRANHWAVAF